MMDSSELAQLQEQNIERPENEKQAQQELESLTAVADLHRCQVWRNVLIVLVILFLILFVTFLVAFLNGSLLVSTSDVKRLARSVKTIWLAALNVPPAFLPQ